MNVTVIGAGNSGLAMAAHLSKEGNCVTLWNRSKSTISKIMQTHIINCEGVICGKVSIDCVTDDMEKAVEKPDVILITTPANAHKDLAELIAKSIKTKTLVVLNPGRTFGALEFSETYTRYNTTVELTTAETQTILYTCRKTDEDAVNIIALKSDILISSTDVKDNSNIIKQLPTCLKNCFVPAQSMIETSIGNVGMVLHCATASLLNTGWTESATCVYKYYYDGITPSIVRLIEKIDQERVDVSEKLGCKVETTCEWLKRTYHIDGEGLYECIHNNEAYTTIDAPQTILHRYIVEDVPCGLVPLEAVGKKLGLDMKYTGLIIDLANAMTENDFRETGRNLANIIKMDSDLSDIKTLLSGEKTMLTNDSDVYAFIKPSLDAHTLGVNSAAEVLRDCGYRVILADPIIERALNDFRLDENKGLIIKWLKKHAITRIGLSYRLDRDVAVRMVGLFVNELKNDSMFSFQGGPIRALYFAGLPGACEAIEKEHKGLVVVFKGGESVRETLEKLHVPTKKIPKDITEGSRYDDLRMEFGKEIVKSREYETTAPSIQTDYKGFATKKDTLVDRLNYRMDMPDFSPLMRVHVGPYSSNVDRTDSVKEFVGWAEYLAKTGFLDILSIGSSQLTQSNFGEDWKGKPNGGGVPVNSPEEYRSIWEACRPLLVRTYAGTKNIPQLAQMHEQTLNISWHALSLWWFNELDGRGPYDLYTNLKQHIETLKYIATTKKPFEPNVSHHFAFRGADDVTYIVSAYLSAKLAKKMGIKTLIVQNMLNTPRFTWGVQDLAKSRAMISLIKELEDDDFTFLLQPRAGLDYFRPDLEEARMQLAAVTALMDDIDPHNEKSPPIIHVVSYSEASHLATPDIVNESIKITKYALQKYRALRRNEKVEDMSKNLDVKERMYELLDSARTIISEIEQHIKDPYSAEGFYRIFASGFLPTPYLWGVDDEFQYAKHWKTKPVRGSVKIVDDNKLPIRCDNIADYAKSNLEQVEYALSQKMPGIKLGGNNFPNV